MVVEAKIPVSQPALASVNQNKMHMLRTTAFTGKNNLITLSHYEFWGFTFHKLNATYSEGTTPNYHIITSCQLYGKC